MAAKEVKFSTDARDRMLQGSDTLAALVAKQGFNFTRDAVTFVDLCVKMNSAMIACWRRELPLPIYIIK